MYAFCGYFLLLQKFIILLCSGEIQTQSVLFWRTKIWSLAAGIPPALQSTPAFSCLCVHVVWLGFFQRSKNDQASQPNPVFCSGSFQVWPVIGGLKSGAVMNQTKPNTSGCEMEKTWFLSGQAVCIRRYFRRVVFMFVWHSEHAEWDWVGEHRQPHWSWWQIILLWPSVVSSSLSFLSLIKKSEKVNILDLKSLHILFPQSKNN